MESDNFYKQPLNLFRKIGFQLHYESGLKGYLRKFQAFYGTFLVFNGLVYHVYYIFCEKRTMEELTEAVSYTLSSIETLVGMITFQLYREDYIYLTNEVLKGLRRGLTINKLEEKLLNSEFQVTK